MFEFIRVQWVMRRIDVAKVQSYVGKWITQEQADAILATAQIPGDSQ
jgi:hypothetical protein